MRRFTWFTLALLLIVGAAAPSHAMVATIATTTPLEDHQEQSVNAALRAAVRTVVAGAAAMGLPWVQISRVLVLDDSVAVQILATDENLEPGTEEEAPDLDSELGADVQPEKHTL